MRQDYDITAVTASVLPEGKLFYNKHDKRDKLGTDAAVLYVRTDDLEEKNGKTVLKADVPIEPLILRAAAGQWIKVILRNGLAMNYPVYRVPTADPAFKKPQRLGYRETRDHQIVWLTPFTDKRVGEGAAYLPSASMYTSTGLAPQLVGFDPIKANGLLVGFNPPDALVLPVQQKKPADLKSIELYWYAGELKPNGAGFEAIPIEFALPISLPRIPWSSRNLAWLAP